MSVVSDYRNTPITDDETLERVSAGLAKVVSSPRTVVSPTTAFQLAFRMKPDPALVTKVRRQMLSRRQVRYRPGFIYAFWDTRDPPTTIKIGRTTQSPRHRISQWDTILGGGDNVVLLFAFSTDDNEFSERLVQNLLRVNWLPKRVNRLTHRSVVEYYFVSDVGDLKLFIDLITRYVNAVVHKNRLSVRTSDVRSVPRTSRPRR